MIKAIQASKSEKVLFVFLIALVFFTFSSFFLLKNKCHFVEKLNLIKKNFQDRENVVEMNIGCGDEFFEFFLELFLQSFKKFKL